MKYVPGPAFGQFSGSQGSTTASRNRYGSYLRNRVQPVNPNTASQTFVRDFFAGLQQGWRDLTESQRTGWAQLAPEVPLVNSLGQEIVLAGNALYTRINILRNQASKATIDDAPALDAAPVLTQSDFTPETGGFTMEWDYTATGGAAANRFLIRASAPRSPGKAFVGRSDLRQINDVAGNVASPVDVVAQYEAIFGQSWRTMAGMEIVLEVLPISENGFPGTPVRTFSLIA